MVKEQRVERQGVDGKGVVSQREGMRLGLCSGAKGL